MDKARIGVIALAGILFLAACSPKSRQPVAASGEASGSSAHAGSAGAVAEKGGSSSPTTSLTEATAATGTPAGPEMQLSQPGSTVRWPRFHGANQDNISPDTGLLSRWPEEGPPLLWQAAGLGHGYSTVTIADGRIFTAGNIGENTVVTALGMDGGVLWQAENGPAWTGEYPGTRGTPTIDGDRVYHESPLGQVSCYEAATGRQVWTLNILDRFEAKNITWALAESLLIDGQHVICCPGGKKASVVALDKNTGQVVWAAPGTGEGAGYASPSLAQWDGLRIIFTMNAKALIAVNADTGELLFRYAHQTNYDVNALMPIYHDGHVLISSGYGSGSELLRLVRSGQKVSVEPVWQTKELDNHHGGVVVLGGYIYGASHEAPNRGKWVCLDWKTGKPTYAERGVGKGSLTCADGMLYVMSERSNVGLVPAVPGQHEVVSQFRLPKGGEGPTWAHPVILDGRLYLRHSDTLFVYNVRAE